MPWWIWILGGLALLALELLTPGGFFIIFFGIGALVVGLLTGLGVIEAGWLEWLLFSAVSIVSLLVFRKPLLEWMKSREPQRGPVDSLVGETAVLTEDLPVGGVVERFGELAKAGNTLVVPANLSDVASMIALAMNVLQARPGAGPGGPPPVR